MAPPVPRKGENPKGNNLGREGGRQRHHRRVHQDSEPVSPFVCSPLCGVATPRVLRTLLRVDLLLEELQGRGLPWDLVGLSPTFSRRSFREEASLGTFKLKRADPVRPPSGRILRRYSPVDIPRPRTPHKPRDSLGLESDGPEELRVNGQTQTRE